MLTFSRLEKYGRLGNQMFQISAVVSHAINNEYQYGFNNWKYNKYLSRPLPTFRGKVLHEHKEISPFAYTPIPNKDNLDFNGYFQNESYFKKNRESILKLFEINDELKNTINSVIFPWRSKKTTAIHVRRGDYLNLSKHHPVLPISYYMEATNLLNKETEQYIIFSDDILWCKNNFKFIKNPLYHHSTNEFMDMIVMSLCNNHIIANSSFSWWGSYLSTLEGKCVAPNKWLGPAYSGVDHSGVYREKMMKV